MTSLLSNIDLLENYDVAVPTGPLHTGINVAEGNADIRAIRLADGRRIPLDSDRPADEAILTALEAGATLPDGVSFDLKSLYVTHPRSPLFSWRHERILRDDFFALFEDSFRRFGQVFDTAWLNNRGAPVSDHSYRQLHLTRRFYFSQDVAAGLTEPFAPGLLRFRTDVSQRLDLPFEGLDFFPQSPDVLPELIFAANFSDLGWPLIRKDARQKLDAFAGQFTFVAPQDWETSSAELSVNVPFDGSWFS